jgi:hypothetical protein
LLVLHNGFQIDSTAGRDFQLIADTELVTCGRRDAFPSAATWDCSAAATVKPVANGEMTEFPESGRFSAIAADFHVNCVVLALARTGSAAPDGDSLLDLSPSSIYQELNS